MRRQNGAILILAGAILLSAGILGEQICQAANRYPSGSVAVGYVGGVGLALIGLIMMVLRDRP